MGFEALPRSWVVWNDEAGGRAVLAYRPDVFDTQDFPAQCLPTLFVTRGAKERRRPPGEGTVATDWRVTLFLEPDVSLPDRSFETRPGAVEGAVEFARAFDRGDVDYRGAYAVPHDTYLDRLDELTGPGSDGREA
jgi:hypothetical protein